MLKSKPGYSKNNKKKPLLGAVFLFKVYELDYLKSESLASFSFTDFTSRTMSIPPMF